MFSPTPRKSKHPYVLSEMSFYFYDLEEPETFGVLNQILLDAGTDLSKIHQMGTVRGKAARARRSYV
jgi:hypothetical protein